MRWCAIAVNGSELKQYAASAALALALGLAVALIGAEIVLRQSGYGPWKELSLDLDMPPMHEPDPELGWRNKEGAYVFGSPPIHMTFWADHTRATAPSPVNADATVVVLGCSFVQGFALSDEDTFAWRLQERFPRARVRNFGTAAYGTTQSLLALERFLDERRRAGTTGALLVVYGFSDFHAARSVATASWLKHLAQLASRGHVATPYADLTASGALQLHGPRAFPAWWLHRRLAMVAFLEDRWTRLEAGERTSQEIAVGQQLLVELDAAARRSGGTLLVALLSQFQKKSMQPFRATLGSRHIATVDCVHRGVWQQDMQVPVYGHPNATINEHWARCIAPAMAKLIGAVDRESERAGASPQ